MLSLTGQLRGKWSIVVWVLTPPAYDYHFHFSAPPNEITVVRAILARH